MQKQRHCSCRRNETARLPRIRLRDCGFLRWEQHVRDTQMDGSSQRSPCCLGLGYPALLSGCCCDLVTMASPVSATSASGIRHEEKSPFRGSSCVTCEIQEEVEDQSLWRYKSVIHNSRKSHRRRNFLLGSHPSRIISSLSGSSLLVGTSRKSICSHASGSK